MTVARGRNPQRGKGHVLDGIGICTRCGACSCCAKSEPKMAAPCEGVMATVRSARGRK